MYVYAEEIFVALCLWAFSEYVYCTKVAESPAVEKYTKLEQTF